MRMSQIYWPQKLNHENFWNPNFGLFHEIFTSENYQPYGIYGKSTQNIRHVRNL